MLREKLAPDFEVPTKATIMPIVGKLVRYGLRDVYVEVYHGESAGPHMPRSFKGHIQVAFCEALRFEGHIQVAFCEALRFEEVIVPAVFAEIEERLAVGERVGAFRFRYDNGDDVVVTWNGIRMGCIRFADWW